MQTVVIGILGTTLDKSHPSQRWERWRPTVAICQQDDLLIDRLELLCPNDAMDLAQSVSADIQQVSPNTRVILHSIQWKDPWDFEEVYNTLFDFCRSYPFNNDEEQYLAHLTTGTHVAQICWFLLTESRHFPGSLIQAAPPKNRDRSSGRYSIIDLDLSRYDSIASRSQQQTNDGLHFLKGGISTRNAAFNRMIEEIEQIAIHSQAPILISGPTGSGKTQLAKRIYALKHARRQVKGAWISVNCSTLRGDAAMATLFGHTKGAFTGANTERTGLLKSADGGMVFLDEIGELGLDEQAMLLHALEEKCFRPLGSDKEIHSDFQLIAGTNRDLGNAVSTGQFRADLLSRINLWSYPLPGLADRREDIEPNLVFECERFANTHGRKVRFNKEAYQLYMDFALSPEARWTGNFRDLMSSITRMATLAGPHRIHREIVTAEISRLRTQWNAPSPTHSPLHERLSSEQLQEIDLFDQLQLREVLTVCRQHRTLSAAGRQLFQSSRLRKSSPNDAHRLKQYLARFGLTWQEARG